MEKRDFVHYISLGHSCYVAEELEGYALRDASYPFDWVASEWHGVESCIRTGFESFLDYDELYQMRKYHHAYRNDKLGIEFFHDFKKNYSLKSQLPPVRKKYTRRIERFYRSITEPTLFFRYIRDEGELEFINKNHGEILSFLKGFCKENEIIYISHEKPRQTAIPCLFFVKKDEGEKVTKTPLSQNAGLEKIMKSLSSPSKDKNIEFEKKKAEAKTEKMQIRRKLEKFAQKHIFKDYIHDKQIY